MKAGDNSRRIKNESREHFTAGEEHRHYYCRKWVPGEHHRKDSRTHQISQASGELIKKKEARALPKWWEQVGQEKNNCTEEQRGLGIYYTQNEGTKYSKFRGGILGILRWVLTDHAFQSGEGILLSLFGFSRNGTVVQGVEIFPTHNANNMIINYN